MARIGIGIMPVKTFVQMIQQENAEGDVFCMVRQEDKHVMSVVLDEDSVKFVAQALEAYKGTEIWHPDMFETMAFGGNGTDVPKSDEEMLEEMEHDEDMNKIKGPWDD